MMVLLVVEKQTPTEAMYLERGTDTYKDVCDWIYSNICRSPKNLQVHHDGEGSIIFTDEDGWETVFTPPTWVVMNEGHDRWWSMTDEQFHSAYTILNP